MVSLVASSCNRTTFASSNTYTWRKEHKALILESLGKADEKSLEVVGFGVAMWLSY